jgi:serpin B
MTQNTAEAELDAMFEGDEPGATHLLEIFQRTTIEVNEKGTDTSEAAGMALARKQIIRFQTPPPEFKANHPFLYMLKGGANTILFMGCVKNGKFA